MLIEHGSESARRARYARLAAFVATLSATMVVSAIGCGDSAESIAAVPASGTVKYKGTPVEKGTIQFAPETGKVAEGTIQGGKFSLSTYKEGDGAVPGKHHVGIIATKEVPSKVKGGEAENVYLVPRNFSTPGGSGITVEIPAAGKTDIDINVVD